MAKLSLFKGTADGEQVGIEWEIPNEVIESRESLRDKLSPLFTLVDHRLLEMNLRIMIANRMVREQSPQFQAAFHNVMEVLHGQRPSDKTFVEVLRGAVMDTITSLVKQGVDKDTLAKIARSTYGADIFVDESAKDDKESIN